MEGVFFLSALFLIPSKQATNLHPYLWRINEMGPPRSEGRKAGRAEGEMSVGPKRGIFQARERKRRQMDHQPENSG